MLKVIDWCDEEAMYHRPIFSLPVGHMWEHKRGVTLIGDAAHLISPFAAEGANLAMLDGLELGMVLADAILDGRTVEERAEAVRDWEEKMLEMAGRIGAVSKANMEAFICDDAPWSAVQTAKAFMQKDRKHV